MTDLKSVKNKHMTLEDRQEIQDCLNHAMTFKDIGRRIGKDQTTISKEVKKHLTIIPPNVKRTRLDGTLIEGAVCPMLLKAPFVCNPCKKKHLQCPFAKQLYQAPSAYKEYKTLLSESRDGIPLNREEFYEMDRVVSEKIKSGQHLYHILQTNDLGVSKSTVYRHLNRGYLSVSSIDFPRVVKFKPRTKRTGQYIPKALKAGRTYNDFKVYIDEAGISSWVEMDTVIGRIGGKVILTLDFTFCNFMAAVLLEDKTALEVADKIKSLKASFSVLNLRFGDVFPLILTDNGGEFANVFAVENAADNQRETKLFFCDPYQSSQKPKVEKNHTLFRDIVPKGQSFDNFTQDTVNLIFSHVNSVARKSLNGKTPYELFVFTYGETVAKILGVKQILPDKVIQSPRLLRVND